MALTVEKLSKDFGGVHALKNVSFEIERGQITGLIGPNGAGKTTCFNVITGFARPTSGTVKVNAHNITGETSYKLAKLGIVRTFQHTSIFGQLTTFDNVRIGYHRHRRSSIIDILISTKKYRKEETEVNRQVNEVLTKVGLSQKAWIKADELSYGEQRRLAIAVAIISKPNFLLLDEPAAGLNPNETSELASIILDLKKENIGILIVEHDMSMVMSICDYIVVLASGELLAKGTPKEIRQNSMVIEAYLGEMKNVKGG